ncbi:unnamed protein product [Thelazia callipaeda]|uniref:C2H2-type domain-containing protein n=1 Tax=Thelazia callipaeda TaxID=103827 RepID=A0A0N5CS01_THECL|nr:unnamed protein product [Thelazia callipaeda]
MSLACHTNSEESNGNRKYTNCFENDKIEEEQKLPHVMLSLISAYFVWMCCPSFSASPAYVSKHVHIGKKPYICVVCKKAFSTSGGFSIHKRTHTNEKAFICDVCKKGFGMYYAFKVHKLVHTGEEHRINAMYERGLDF